MPSSGSGLWLGLSRLFYRGWGIRSGCLYAGVWLEQKRLGPSGKCELMFKLIHILASYVFWLIKKALPRFQKGNDNGEFVFFFPECLCPHIEFEVVIILPKGTVFLKLKRIDPCIIVCYAVANSSLITWMTMIISSPSLSIKFHKN